MGYMRNRGPATKPEARLSDWRITATEKPSVWADWIDGIGLRDISPIFILGGMLFLCIGAMTQIKWTEESAQNAAVGFLIGATIAGQHR